MLKKLKKKSRENLSGQEGISFKKNSFGTKIRIRSREYKGFFVEKNSQKQNI